MGLAFEPTLFTFYHYYLLGLEHTYLPGWVDSDLLPVSLSPTYPNSLHSSPSQDDTMSQLFLFGQWKEGRGFFHSNNKITCILLKTGQVVFLILHTILPHFLLHLLLLVNFVRAIPPPHSERYLFSL